MTILLAPDKFKGSLRAAEVCEALAKGLQQSYPQARILACPLADGGDGSLDVLAAYYDLQTVSKEVSDPLGRPVTAAYQLAGDTAYVELAAASGIALVQTSALNTMDASTLGTGQLIADALDRGIQTLYLFIGGSATTDGGLGIAHALGYRFYGQQGQELLPTGRQLIHLDRIDNSKVHPRLGEVEVQVICDVENLLTGPQGAAHIYGPQKGATPEQVLQLDSGLAHLANCLRQQGYPDIRTLAGAGAAGGVGGGAVALLGGRLVSGTATFLELSHFEDKLQQADLLITGEGKLDSQTQQGKLISGVCKMAHQYAKPIIAVCGAAEDGVGQALGLQQVHTVLERCSSLEEAIGNAAAVLTEIGAEMVWGK